MVKKLMYCLCLIVITTISAIYYFDALVDDTSTYARTIKIEKQHTLAVPTIYVVTPTFTRLEQKADLTQLRNTLCLIPNIHWIVVEDSLNKTSLVGNFLSNCSIPFTHLNALTPMIGETGARHRGVAQRNEGITWLRALQNNNGVVYFADDDNTYDTHLFEEMRYTKKVTVWPVGLAGGLVYEAPILHNGSVIAWRSFYKVRKFATDMAGFAVNVKLLKEKPAAWFSMDAKPGELEDDFLQHLDISLKDLEPKANGCTKDVDHDNFSRERVPQDHGGWKEGVLVIITRSGNLSEGQVIHIWGLTTEGIDTVTRSFTIS